MPRDVRDKIMMPFHAVRREIGEPTQIAGRRVTYRQRAAVFAFVISRRSPPPIIAVFGHAGIIVGPSAGIGAALKPGYPQRNLFACRTGNAEMEPLRKFRILVFADTKGGGCAFNRVDDDVAAIKGGVDVSNAHGTRIVSPDTPGKS